MDGATVKRKKIPSLLDLCVQTAIDNLRYIGDVGEVDTHLLERILPHCTVDQLTSIENSTEGRDLSSVTDDLWKRFYMKQFGQESADLVISRMKQKKVIFKWQQLYEAKMKEREQFQNKSAQRLKQRYQEEQEKKQSRQVKYTKLAPPSSYKRSWSSGSSSYNVSNLKSNILKKAKIECLNSHEAKIHATMRKNAIQRQSYPPQRYFTYFIVSSTVNVSLCLLPYLQHLSFDEAGQFSEDKFGIRLQAIEAPRKRIIIWGGTSSVLEICCNGYNSQFMS